MKVVKLYADWCPPCKTYVPIFENVKQEMSSDNIQFEEWNLDDLSEEVKDNLTKVSMIRSVPHTLFYDENDNLIKALPGKLSEEELRDSIRLTATE